MMLISWHSRKLQNTHESVKVLSSDRISLIADRRGKETSLFSINTRMSDEHKTKGLLMSALNSVNCLSVVRSLTRRTRISGWSNQSGGYRFANPGPRSKNFPVVCERVVCGRIFCISGESLLYVFSSWNYNYLGVCSGNQRLIDGIRAEVKLYARFLS
jgi:hypothetical protein